MTTYRQLLAGMGLLNGSRGHLPHAASA